MSPPRHGITGRAIAIGIAASAGFAALTVFLSNRKDMEMTACQIPVLPYVLLFLMVLAVNPLCRLLRVIRPLSPAEILLVFAMGAVSSGISLYGLSAQLIPVVGNLFNPHWNNAQNEWSRYIEPRVSEKYFLAAPGVQEVAIPYREAVLELESLRGAYDAAVGVAKARGAAAQTAAQARWDAAAAARPGLRGQEPAAAAERLAEQIRAQEAAVRERREALRRREAPAFAEVEAFRRGFPPEKRAFPGFLPLSDDTWTSYAGRLQRFVRGQRALAGLRAAARDADRPAVAAAHLARATGILAPAAQTGPADARLAALRARQDAARAELLRFEAALDELYQRNRFAAPSEQGALAPLLSRAARDRARVRKDQARIAALLENARRERESAVGVSGVCEALRDLARDAAASAPAADLRARLAALEGGFPAIDGTWRRFLLGDVPWRAWRAPLARWGLFIGLTYVVLMTFNILIFRQWAHHEKLIYPLARLPEELAGAGDEGAGLVPSVLRSGLFWAGAAVSAAVLGWNLLCATEAVPGLQAIDLTNLWQPFIRNSALEGLLPGARSTVFFTMIGLAFLIPQKISFSLWFFHVLYMVQLLGLVGAGHGVNEDSFPTDWWYTMNFRTAEGGGALLVFSSVVLYKCRTYLLCALFPSSLADLDAGERRELRVSSLLFLAGSLGIVLLLWRSLGVPPGFVLFYGFLVLVLTIGLVRAVAEGGILSLKVFASPFHFFRTLFGMDGAWNSSWLLSPLVFYHVVFFNDLKGFIAPAMANALKVRDDLRLARGRFYGAIAAAILVAVAVALGTEIMMGYSKGADNMNRWFHSMFAKDLFDQVTALTKSPPAVAAAERKWVGAGAAAMAALLYLRRTIFWLPHPIGLIMLVNPIMKTYWFSILIGWAAKSLVTRYGNKDTYARTRGFFIGLIAGEILLVIAAMVASLLLGIKIPIDLDRN